MAAKIQSLCCLIILLMLLTHGISSTRSKLFQAMEKENNRKETSTMVMVDNNMSELDPGKASLFLLAKSHVPPSGPSHRGNNAPH